MSTEERLRQAIESGEIVKITYDGGSQPGALRDVAPMSVRDGKVRARCFASNAVKVFVIDKIEVVEGQQKKAGGEWNLSAIERPVFGSLSEFLDKKRKLLSKLGWHIEANDKVLSLHRRFKNGKPTKGWDVSLEYKEFTFELVLGDDGEFHEEEKRKRKQPWSGRATNHNTRTFGTFEKASTAFIECAEALAPVNR